MCWSRKGVPGSKRSGEAGTPFLGPAAEPNFDSERAAGSSDRGPSHERRPNGPPIRRPAGRTGDYASVFAPRVSAGGRETSSGCKERRQLVLDDARLTDPRLLAKHRRHARRPPHHPIASEDLL